MGLFRRRGPRRKERTHVTAVESASRGLELFKHVIDHAHDPTFLHSPADGFRLMYVNEAACRHFGRPADALLRMSVADLDPDYPLERLQERWQELKQKTAITIETVNRR